MPYALSFTKSVVIADPETGQFQVHLTARRRRLVFGDEKYLPIPG